MEPSKNHHSWFAVPPTAHTRVCRVWNPERVREESRCKSLLMSLVSRAPLGGQVCPRVRRESPTARVPNERAWSPTRLVGHTPMGSYTRKGVLLPSRCLLESPFLEPLLRTLLRTLLPTKTHSKTPSKNPSKEPSRKQSREPF